MTRLLAVLVLAGALAAPAGAGTVAVGVEDGADPAAVAQAVEASTGARLVADLGPLDALVFEDASAQALDSVPGVTYAEPLTGGERRLMFVPNDPLLADQWYIPFVRAFDHWVAPPPQPAVRVAVIDSGVDGTHPELASRIAASKSFVGGSALTDAFGHGTIVSGEIAAGLNNGVGIAGAGIPVELLVAKVVDHDGFISLVNEARAIRWAVDQGAQVINLSLGGPRDPGNPRRDSYSPLEHDAVDYATRHGVVVVAAGGNCSLLRCPERYASWPAALPHVVGVGALGPSGTTPGFSNRDRRHIDLAAPGQDIVSLFPTDRTGAGCTTGYTDCVLRAADGTSFSAPLVVAAAAVLLGERGLLGQTALHASQTALVLERSAADIGPGGRDAASGNGKLDVAAALEALGGTLPPRDRFEPNDDTGRRALPLARGTRSLRATLERWEDGRDVYRVPLRRGERLSAFVAGPRGTNVNLFLWRPGAGHVGVLADRLASAVGPGANARLVHRAGRTGLYNLEIRLVSGTGGPYGVTLRR